MSITEKEFESRLNLVLQTLQEKLKKHGSNSNTLKPKVGVILGSGLGSITEALQDSVVIPYSSIPHFHPTTVQGHAGELVIGRLENVTCAFLKGRFHAYEGHSQQDVTFPTRVLCALGIETLVLTNAAGGINTRFRAGDLMIIEDQINLSGANPLTGMNFSTRGPRFPDMSSAYNLEGREILEKNATQLGIGIQKGVYVGLSGPAYETPAEIRMLRTLGADAVGMSTVGECIVANHEGRRVVGLSLISNLASGLSTQKLSHDEVMESSQDGSALMRKLIEKSIPDLARLPCMNKN